MENWKLKSRFDVVVTVHQIVEDLEGNLLADKIVTQIFTIENGLIKTFEIGFSEN